MTAGKYYDMEDDEEGFGDFTDLDTDFQLRVNDMTLRDHFAGLALQGMMANNPLFANAEVAYQKADQMMKARNETR